MCPSFSNSKVRSVPLTIPFAAAKTTLAFTGVLAFRVSWCTAVPSHLNCREQATFLCSSSWVEWSLLQIQPSSNLHDTVSGTSTLYSLLDLESLWQSASLLLYKFSYFSHIYSIYKAVTFIYPTTVSAIFYMNNNCQMSSTSQSKFRINAKWLHQVDILAKNTFF